MTSAFDSGCQLSLMLSASTGDSAGKDLRSFGNAFLKSCNILVINVLYLVCTESANFLSFAGFEGFLHILINEYYLL